AAARERPRERPQSDPGSSHPRRGTRLPGTCRECYIAHNPRPIGREEDVMIPQPLAGFDPKEWAKKDFTERVRIGTNIYVLKGLGFPLSAYLFHAAKLCLFILGWMFFCRFTPGLGTVANFRSWIFEGTAFQKAFLWASLVEVMGLGCMSGPLGLRM